MSITSELTETEVAEESAYPALKALNNGMVVLFTESGTGVIVHSTSTIHSVGYLSRYWIEELFEPLPSGSTITLTQV